MRYTLRFLTLIILLAAACSTLPETTEVAPSTIVPDPPTSVSTSASVMTEEVGAEQTVEAAQTAAPVVIDITVPPPGTLIAAVTEDPVADLPFDSIIYEQSGGLNATTMIVEVYSDGRVVRDGTTINVSAEDIAALDQALRDINFFGIQGQFTVPGPAADIYVYKMTMEKDGASRTINAQDGYTPDELMRIFNTLSRLGTE